MRAIALDGQVPVPEEAGGIVPHPLLAIPCLRPVPADVRRLTIEGHRALVEALGAQVYVYLDGTDVTDRTQMAVRSRDGRPGSVRLYDVNAEGLKLPLLRRFRGEVEFYYLGRA